MGAVTLSFLFFLLIFVAVGVASSRFCQSTTADYLLAGRSVPAWLAALSAVATNNSGFMFIGQIAYTWQVGVASVWMMVGWVVGDLVAWYLVHPRVRSISEDANLLTVPALMSMSSNGRQRVVTVVAGALIFVFLGVYAAAQLKAGSTALQTLFGWEPQIGAVLGAMIVVLYCFSGGLRASIWTDAAQSFVMISAMIALLIAGSLKAGSPADVWRNLEAQDPALVRLIPAGLKFGFFPYLIGMVFGGFGAAGQPHILVRFMSIRSRSEIAAARRIYFAWFIPFFLASIAVGLYSRACIPDLTTIPLADGLDDMQASELAMPAMAQLLLPDILIGLTLAGLFAATMSTADSQILVCSSAVTQDLLPEYKHSVIASKLATLSVAAIALAIALFARKGVFSLVMIAWSALGAGLAPALILKLYGQKLSARTTILMMLAGISTVAVWQRAGLDGEVFKLLPGMLAGFLAWPVGQAIDCLIDQPAKPPR